MQTPWYRTFESLLAVWYKKSYHTAGVNWQLCDTERLRGYGAQHCTMHSGYAYVFASGTGIWWVTKLWLVLANHLLWISNKETFFFFVEQNNIFECNNAWHLLGSWHHRGGMGTFSLKKKKKILSPHPTLCHQIITNVLNLDPNKIFYSPQKWCWCHHCLSG